MRLPAIVKGEAAVFSRTFRAVASSANRMYPNPLGPTSRMPATSTPSDVIASNRSSSVAVSGTDPTQTVQLPGCDGATTTVGCTSAFGCGSGRISRLSRGATADLSLDFSSFRSTRSDRSTRSTRSDSRSVRLEDTRDAYRSSSRLSGDSLLRLDLYAGGDSRRLVRRSGVGLR